MANEDKKIVTVEGLEKVREKLDERYVLEGEYSPNTSVGLSRLAENLTPYSSESGTEQDIPFITQGTGCGNGSTQVDTGSYAQITAKKGNVVVVNQLAKSLTDGNWSKYHATVSYNNGVATVTANSSYGCIMCSLPTQAGHKYWICATIKKSSASSNIALVVVDGGSKAVASSEATTAIQTICGIHTCVNPNDTNTFIIEDRSAGDFASFDILGAYFIDLTLMYGNNAWIPSDLLSHPKNFYRYYQGSLAYDTGSFVHANGRYLVTTGRNILDGENCIVVPGATYHILGAATITFKDSLGSTISSASYTDETFLVPANCTSLGVSGVGDITTSLYYTGESGYNDHYPYEELDNIDTGTEELLQAGEASDTKAKDGTITHNLVEINLSEKTWTLVEGDGYWYFVGSSPSNIRSVGSANLPNAHSDKYVTVEMNNAGLSNNTFAIDSQFILVRTSSTSVTPTGTIIAELDEPTTEQGTPYESTLNINDFGTMYWLTSDNATPSVPQGIEIFYPVDYKAFVDSVYNHTDGDASNVATTDELGEKETELKAVDTILQNAIGGTLRQLLAVSKSIDFGNTAVVDLGNLIWTKASNDYHSYYATISNINTTITENQLANIICTQYKQSVAKYGGTYNYDGSKDKTIWKLVSSEPNARIIITDTNYNDATALKTAMKGVLLAYEKA